MRDLINYNPFGTSAVWTPSDSTGNTDMTSELEAFVAANQGSRVVVSDTAIIKLKNAFRTVTTGDVIIDFGRAIILYDNNVTGDAALYLDNTANASAEVTVNSISNANQVNSDVKVTQLTLASTLNAQRFDWLAFTTTNANPAKSGGQLGEICQVIKNETGLVVSLTRQLNRFSQYSTAMRARILDKSRKVIIRGGIWRADGDVHDHAITNRCPCILIQGFVDPEVYDIEFDKPWSIGIMLKCNAAPKVRNVRMNDVGNLANYNGYTYGVSLYGMNDAADIRDIFCRNGRHGAFTTDGNSGSTSTWHQKGIPTNFVVDGVHGYNCHASVVDTHEEGDGGHISNVWSFDPSQDEDIAPDFASTHIQHRCANTKFTNIHFKGGNRGFKINAVDHGFEDQVTIINFDASNSIPTATTDGDIPLSIDSQSALTNKRLIIVKGMECNNVGKCISVGATAKLRASGFTAKNFDVFLDANAGCEIIWADAPFLDYRNSSRSGGLECVQVRSAAASGPTVLFMQKPIILKGDAINKPTLFFDERDTTATKTIWCPGLTEYNPSNTTRTVIYEATATSFAWANISNSTNREVRVHTAAGAATLLDTDNVLVVNKTSGAATVVNLPAPALPGRSFTIKDGKGDAGTNNITLTPAAGNIDGAGTKVISTNYGVVTIVHNGTEWNSI